MLLDAISPEGKGLWDNIKLVSQIASYAGTAAATALSVYAMLYKPTIDPENPEAVKRLTKAGRNQLIGFLIVSIVAVTSTMMKDVADNQLRRQGAVREADAKKTAERELLEALGKNFTDFAKAELAPAFTNINKGIGASTEHLQKGISKSVDTFSSGLQGTSSQIKRAMLETSEETASASLQIGSYELEIELPVQKQATRKHASVAMFDEDELLVMQGCGQLNAKPLYDTSTCRSLVDALHARQHMAAFLEQLLPSRRDGIEVVVAFQYLLTRIHVSAECHLLEGILEGARQADHSCISAYDYATAVTDPSRVEVIQPESADFLGDAGPRLRYKESGTSDNDDGKHTANFLNKFGRDVEVNSISLNLDVDSMLVAARLPKILAVKQTIHPWDGSKDVVRYYLLYRKLWRQEQSMYKHKKGIGALYTRY